VNYDDELIVLREADETEISLSAGEAAELQSAGLYVQPLAPASDDGLLRTYAVKGNHQVGYFRLASGRLVLIETKVPIANVFSLLAASYRFYARNPPFLQHTVPYAATRERPLHALVEHFSNIVETLLRDGLLRRYVQNEDNLSIVRGRIVFEQQIRQNLVRGDRLFCRFSESDVDNFENRIVLWTLLLLQRSHQWPGSLRRKLQGQIMHFGGVSIVPISRLDFPRLVYDRLNRRYAELHDWCRFFVNQMTLLNRNGTVEFQGFRLNMFQLFERFVFCVFRKAADSRFGIQLEKAPFPLDIHGKVGIHPDLVIRGRSFIAVGDAKYKITRDQQGRHPDLYQVVAYATAFGLINAANRPQAFLVYPATERTAELEGDLHILTSTEGKSALTIRTLWFDLAGENVFDKAVALASSVLSDILVERRREGEIAGPPS
jgi:5-methylcytosine-specific restriction enzyme subunit McrC